MGDYTDFSIDFPARCRDVLKLAQEPAQAGGREVTLLIMTAAAAFLIPFERLRAGGSTGHPVHQDREFYPELTRRLDSALGRPFIESPFYNASDRGWRFGTSKDMEVKPSSFEQDGLTKKTPASEVLGIIRNALAHGNLATLGDGSRRSPINGLAFFSEHRKDGKRVGFKYVYVSPDEFNNFLGKWLEFLASENMSQRLVGETLASIA